jgi:hypothetical protein
MKTSLLYRFASTCFAALVSLVLAGCGGGGGDAGSSPFGPGAKAPTLTLALSSTNVTANTPVTVTATVRDGNGQPVSGIVVSLSLGRPELSVLNASSVLTDAQGEARAVLSASTSGITGADDLSATATVGTASVQTRLGFSVIGALPTLNASIESTTLSGSRGPVRVSAVLRDAAGRTLAGQIVNFSSVGSKVRLSQVSALTDAQGVATTTAQPADPTIASADTVLASATVAGREVQSPLNVQIVAEPAAPAKIPSLILALSSPELNSLTPTVVTATVRDASGLPVPGIVVRLSTTRVDLATLSSSSVLTDAQGVGRLTISPVNSGVTGADDLNATATLGTTALSARVGFSVPGSTASINASIASSTLRGSTGPVQLTARVRNAVGQSVEGQVVNFASPAGVLRFNPISARTDATGVAITNVTPADTTLGVAETIVASTSIDGRTLQSQVSVQVIGEPAVAPRTPTLELAVSSTGVTAASPTTVTATVRDAAGLPVEGVVVGLSTSRTGLGVLSAASVLTDASGQGRVSLSAASGGLTGADDVIGSATVGTTAVNARVGFNVTGSVPTLQALVDTATLRASLGPVRFTAVVLNAQGQRLPGQLVSFGSSTGAIRISPATALTDSNGTATTFVQPADAGSGLADTLVASAVVSGRQVQGTVSVEVLAEEPSISLTVNPSQGIGTGSPATVQAIVRDASGNIVPNAIVSFSTPGRLGSFSADSAVTAANTGAATVVLRPATATTAGADVVRASVTVAGVSRTRDQVVQFVPAAVPAAPSILLTLNGDNTITPQTPATVTLQLRDGLQNAVGGAVVTLRTVRGNLATPSVASVLTNSQGQATAALSSAGSGVTGADELVATATVGGISVQSTVGFTVTGAAPSLQLALQPDSALKASTSPPATLTATLFDAAGQRQAGQLVRFEAVNSLTQLSAPSAVTNTRGEASVTVRPSNPQNNGAEVLRASATLAGRDLQATKSVDLIRESPSVDLIFTGNSSATVAAPAGLRATVKDLLGNQVKDAIVRFSTQGGLGTFSAASVATDSNGEAVTSVAPLSAATASADTVVATATVNGVTVSQTQVVSFAPSSAPVAKITLSVNPESINSATPATVTAVVTDSGGRNLAGQVVTFSVARGLARTNPVTAFTGAQDSTDPKATVQLVPTTPTGVGADEVTASVTLGGTTLTATKGFSVNVNATDIEPVLTVPDPGATLAAYGQTPVNLSFRPPISGSPVSVSVTSSCIVAGKAFISPSSFTTASSVELLYKDNGCGALQPQDSVQAVVVGSSKSATVTIPLSRPGVSSIAFVQASPELIYLKGSGLAESATLTFEVRDAAGNPVRNQQAQLKLLTGAGGVTMEDQTVGSTVSLRSDAAGRVTARVNSGTLPTPVRVQASITPSSGVTVSTVSSNLSVSVGLPSQLNFSLAQGTRNIEGYNIDGTANTYSIIASDRNGNPVPAGTAINFVTEGGSVEPTKQTQLVSGLARVTANFVSSEPRPLDGRITVTAYALGEESFIDLNGNNAFDPVLTSGNVTLTSGSAIAVLSAPNAAVQPGQTLSGSGIPPGATVLAVSGSNITMSQAATGSGLVNTSFGEPFQDLGNIFKDRNFDGVYDAATDEFIPLLITNSAACRPVDNPLLDLDASIPSMASTCSGNWSGAGQVYVRRSIETVLSTSAARPLWASVSGLEASCRRIRLQTGPLLPGSAAPPSVVRALAGGDTWYNMNAEGVLSFIIADANPGRPVVSPTSDLSNAANWIVLPRMNPVAAGSLVNASTSSRGLVVAPAGGSPVASTTEATLAAVTYSFTDPAVQAGVITLSVKSPSGLEVSYSIGVDRSRGPASTCSVDP